MEPDSIVSPEPESDAELAFEGALRPKSLAEFVGQFQGSGAAAVVAPGGRDPEPNTRSTFFLLALPVSARPLLP